MKKFFGSMFALLTLVLFYGPVYGQDNSLKEKEIAIAGTVPAEWGSLKVVLPGPKEYQMRLFFEDNRGTIRMVTLSNVEAMGPDVYTVVWGNVPVIRRSR